MVVCPQRLEFLREMRKKHGLTFEIVRDEGNQYADELGLRMVLPEYLRPVYLELGIDLPRVNGESSWSLPMPARYVINRQGIIESADVNPDYTSRPEPEKTVEDVRRIG